MTPCLSFPPLTHLAPMADFTNGTTYIGQCCIVARGSKIRFILDSSNETLLTSSEKPSLTIPSTVALSTPLGNTLSHNLTVYFIAALITCNCVHFYLFAVSPLDCKAQEVIISQPNNYLTLRKLLNFSASVFLPVKWINYEVLGVLMT